MIAATSLLGSGQLWSLSSTVRDDGEGNGARYIVHVVKPGDTLSDIAYDHYVEVLALRQANGLMHEGKGRESWAQVLYEGQRIKIPVTPGNRHMVVDAAGESRGGGGGVDGAADAASTNGSGGGDRREKGRHQQQQQKRSGGGSGSNSSSSSSKSYSAGAGDAATRSSSSSQTPPPPPLPSASSDRGGLAIDDAPGADAVNGILPSEWRIPYVHMVGVRRGGAGVEEEEAEEEEPCFVVCLLSINVALLLSAHSSTRAFLSCSRRCLDAQQHQFYVSLSLLLKRPVT